VVRARGARQDQLLEQLRDGKGVQFTEALVSAIPRLEGEAKRKGRDALADRMTRMSDKTLAAYLQDEEPELRAAAALACAMKESKERVPDLIRLLSDPEAVVERSAHAALKSLTGQDCGPSAGADRAERAKAIAAWKVWWDKQSRR
jgi:HEAT repeat protein